MVTFLRVKDFCKDFMGVDPGGGGGGALPYIHFYRYSEGKGYVGFIGRCCIG